jgi:hypothetical protein
MSEARGGARSLCVRAWKDNSPRGTRRAVASLLYADANWIPRAAPRRGAWRACDGERAAPARAPRVWLRRRGRGSGGMGRPWQLLFGQQASLLHEGHDSRESERAGVPNTDTGHFCLRACLTLDATVFFFF